MFVRKSWLAVLMMPLLLGLALAPPAEARKRRKKKVPPPIEETQPTEQTGAPPAATGSATGIAPTPPPTPQAPTPAAQEEQPAPQDSKGKRRKRAQKAQPAAPAQAETKPAADPAPAPAPADPPAPAPAAPQAPGDDKSGIFMANLRTGGAIGVSNISGQFVLSPEFGIAVLPNKAGYIVFPLQFQFGGGFTTIMLPVGFQYDVPLRAVPGLYLTPRVSLGYTALIEDLGLGHTVTTSAGVFMPEFGAKYVFRKRWNFGGEVFSLPVLFASGGVAVQYRLMFYAGVNF